jgi:hypothetical protein
MTQHLVYSCNREFGCVVHQHTAHDCYWRYVDEAWECGTNIVVPAVLSYSQWLERRSD